MIFAVNFFLLSFNIPKNPSSLVVSRLWFHSSVWRDTLPCSFVSIVRRELIVFRNARPLNAMGMPTSTAEHTHLGRFPFGVAEVRHVLVHKDCTPRYSRRIRKHAEPGDVRAREEPGEPIELLADCADAFGNTDGVVEDGVRRVDVVRFLCGVRYYGVIVGLGTPDVDDLRW